MCHLLHQYSYQFDQSALEYMQTRDYWNPYTCARTRTRIYVNAS